MYGSARFKQRLVRVLPKAGDVPKSSLLQLAALVRIGGNESILKKKLWSYRDAADCMARDHHTLNLRDHR